MTEGMGLVRVLGRVTALFHIALALACGGFALRAAAGLAFAPAEARLATTGMLAPLLLVLLAASAGLIVLARRVWTDPAGASRALIGLHAPLLGLGLLLVAYGRMAQAAAARSAATGGGLLGGFGDVVLIAGLGLTVLSGSALFCAWAAARHRATHQSVGL